MAISDIASLVVGKILDSAEPVSTAIENSMAAEPGPPTGVRPFTGADASGAALMAKLGARVFQRARERREENMKRQKADLDEQYRRAQIEHLTRAATDQVPRDQSVTVGDRTFTGLTADQAARLQHDISNDPKPEEMVTTGEDGKPLPFPMKRSEYLTLRGQNLAHTDRAAMRDAIRAAAERRAGSGRAATDGLSALRYLGAQPNEGEVWNRAAADAAAQVDSTATATGRRWLPGAKGKAQRQQEIERVATGIYRKAMAQQDSVRQAPLRVLRSGFEADSTAAAQDDPFLKQLQGLFN